METSDGEFEVPNEALESTLGIAPSGLEFCFDRRGFLTKHFDEDNFIVDRLKMGISLESLHDSLLQYFNILKNSLVELINQDYADFVNLSTNLFGLEKIIDSLESPLVHVKESVLAVLKDIQNTKQDFRHSLEERKLLREKKARPPADSGSLHNATAKVVDTGAPNHMGKETADADVPSDSVVEESSNEFFPPSTSWENQASTTLQEEQRIDRVAQEYTKLQYFTRKCGDHPFIKDLKPLIQVITASLHEQLEGRLRSGLDLCHELHDACQSGKGFTLEQQTAAVRSTSAALRQVLSTYLSIDKLSDAALLYRRHSLQAKLKQIFSSCPELSSSSADSMAAASELRSRYALALDFLDSECLIFKQFVFKRTHKSYEPLSEFDPLVDGFFPETVQILFQQLPDIFSAGNPERFFELYTASIEFLDGIELRTDSLKQVQKLRQHPSYSAFLGKWSLPVYFQLRFQKATQIALEALRTPWKKAESGSLGCSLNVTETVLEQIIWCWSEKVYLPSLRHRFWKLALQLLNAFVYAIKSAQPPVDDAQNDLLGIKSLFALLTDGHLVLRWISDGHLEKLVLRDFPSTTIGPKTVNSDNLETVHDTPVWLTECLEDSSDQIRSALECVKTKVRTSFQESMRGLIRQVQDLPRKYRRTSREWPTSPSHYMLSINKNLSTLAEEMTSALTRSGPASSENLENEIKTLFDDLVLETTQMYQAQTEDLLASVKKVEDSLRRLRVARSGATVTSAAQTDDDKIRHQVHLDTTAYAKHLETLSLLSKAGLQASLAALSPNAATPSDCPAGSL
ncbi:Conserved oligomeric Golgi complex subunit 2 [Sparganum proliferum]